MRQYRCDYTIVVDAAALVSCPVWDYSETYVHMLATVGAPYINISSQLPAHIRGLVQLLYIVLRFSRARRTSETIEYQLTYAGSPVAV